MQYKIAVPSYMRHQTIQKKTLAVFDKYGIEPDLVTIFVSDEAQRQVYADALANNKYGKNIVVGVPTIGAQRNFIEKYYPEGTYLMMFDDDIESVCRKSGPQSLCEVDDLEKEIIVRGFTECVAAGAKTFGIYAAPNAYFMKDRVYTELCYIIASMFGVIVQHDTSLERVTNHGEDYEYSIRQYIKNGAVCRLDNYTVKSKYFGEEGGLQTVRTKDYIYNSIKQIADKFPGYCDMYIRKSTGNAELRLRDKYPVVRKLNTSLFEYE